MTNEITFAVDNTTGSAHTIITGVYKLAIAAIENGHDALADDYTALAHDLEAQLAAQDPIEPPQQTTLSGW